MPDQIHSEALKRVKKRFGNQDDALIHGIVMGLFASVSGALLTLLGGGFAGMNGIVYLIAIAWSLGLSAYGVYAYQRSAANKNHREKVIQEQLVKLSNEYDVSPDELADLHESIDSEVRHHAAPLVLHTISAVSFAALWISGLVFALANAGAAADGSSAGLAIPVMLLISSFILTGQFIAGYVLRPRNDEDSDVRETYLRAIYSTKTEKRKRLASERLTIDDEGEIVLEDAQENRIKSKESLTMPDQLYVEAHERIRQRLSSVTMPMIHALIFGVVISVGGFLNSLSAGFLSRIDSPIIYLGAIAWSCILFVHTLYAYRRSAVNKSHRENVIQEQLLRLANEYDLSTDELAELHEHLSDNVRQQAASFTPLMISAGSLAALWVGALIFGNIVLAFRSMTSDMVDLITQGIPLIGTYIITTQMIAALVLRQGKPEDREMRAAYLRALYSTKTSKRKRLASERLTIDDEGEIISEQDFAPHQKNQR